MAWISLRDILGGGMGFLSKLGGIAGGALGFAVGGPAGAAIGYGLGNAASGGGGNLFDKQSQVQTGNTGFSSMGAPQQSYLSGRVWNDITKQYETPYEQVGYQNYISGFTQPALAGMNKLGSGQPLGNGGMVAGQQGVTGMNNFSSRFADPYMQQAGDLTGMGAQRINYSDVEAARNPYASALQNRLNEEMNKTMAAKKAQLGMRGGRSFGDISTGTQLGALEAERQSKMSDIDYNTYRDAMASEEALKNRQMTGGGQFGQLAGQAQAITNQQFANEMDKYKTQFDMGQGITDAQRRSAYDQIAVGGMQQAQSQAINDARLKDEMEKRGYNAQRIATILGQIPAYQSNQNYDYINKPGLMSQAGQLGQFGASLFG